MNYDIPEHITQLFAEIDRFIEDKIKPLEEKDDNIRFFDHRREYSRTDWENGGTPDDEWEDLLTEVEGNGR